MIQNQTAGQLELLSQFMDELERTESREQYDWILGKIVEVAGTYLEAEKESGADTICIRMEICLQWKISDKAWQNPCIKLKIMQDPGCLLRGKCGCAAECR